MGMIISVHVQLVLNCVHASLSQIVVYCSASCP